MSEKKPKASSPKTDQIRALREARAEEQERRQREAVDTRAKTKRGARR